MANSRRANPYPGPRPFEPREGSLFFGRESETDDLVSLVSSHKVILVYAQSGVGKTSLLNAKLVPKLTERGFRFLRSVRFLETFTDSKSMPADGNVYILNALLSWTAEGTNPQELSGTSLDEFLTREKASP